MSSLCFKKVAHCCKIIRTSLNAVCNGLGPIQIGSNEQFPDGWGKAAKGRTVWRIVEEAIKQNLKKDSEKLGVDEVTPSESESSIYDVSLRIPNITPVLFLNFKAAVDGNETEKGDISKAGKLIEFYDEGATRQLIIVTFVISFHDNMTIQINRCLVTPIAWLPDIYVNPSNNGNLQCSQPETLEDATRRSNQAFLKLLKRAISTAKRKQTAKRKEMETAK
jgi:hypothetical protein